MFLEVLQRDKKNDEDFTPADFCRIVTDQLC